MENDNNSVQVIRGLLSKIGQTSPQCILHTVVLWTWRPAQNSWGVSMLLCAASSVVAFTFGGVVSPRWLQHESCVLSLSHLDYNGCSRRRLGACRAEAASIDIGVHVGKEVDPGAKNFEDNLDERIVDIMYGDDSDKEGDAEENRSLSPARLRCCLNYY